MVVRPPGADCFAREANRDYIRALVELYSAWGREVERKKFEQLLRDG